MEVTASLREKALLILAEIKKAKSILLHCHPSPDPDSVGSALAMKFAVEQLGKKATVIRGDSQFPKGFGHFPGANDIVNQNFFETDLSKYDLFIILDSARKEMISRRGQVEFPGTMMTIVIDHHQSNSQFAKINLIEPSYPANCLLLYDIFKLWSIRMTPEIAANLFIGSYSDTGGFKYAGVGPEAYATIAELVRYIPNVSKLITTMENSNTREFLVFDAAALSSIAVYGHGRLAISTVPLSFIKDKNISMSDVRTNEVSSFMLTVAAWDVVAAAVEIEPNVIKFSFRSKDPDKFDVARLAQELGGGGHKAAAGLILNASMTEAIKKVVEKAEELYNL